MVCVLKSSAQCRRGSLSGGVKHRGEMFNKGGYVCTKAASQWEKLDIIKARIQLGCARFADFLENFSER